MTKKRFRELYAHLYQLDNNPEEIYGYVYNYKKQECSRKKKFCGANFRYWRGNCYRAVQIELRHNLGWMKEIYHRDGRMGVRWTTEIARNLKTHCKIHEEYLYNGLRHCSSGPAFRLFDDNGKVIRYRTLYYLHGVQVSHKVIHNPKSLTLTNIDDFQNIESQRVAIERLGWIDFLKMLKPVVIDESVDEISNTKQTLFRTNRALLRFDNLLRGNFLICSCPSTARVYPIRVPQHIRTCQEAQKWLIGNRYRKARIIGAS